MEEEQPCELISACSLHFHSESPHLANHIHYALLEVDISVVLVTGATGFVGTHCVRELLAQNYRVRGTVRDKKAFRKVKIVDLHLLRNYHSDHSTSSSSERQRKSRVIRDWSTRSEGEMDWVRLLSTWIFWKCICSELWTEWPSSFTSRVLFPSNQQKRQFEQLSQEQWLYWKLLLSFTQYVNYDAILVGFYSYSNHYPVLWGR